MARKSWKLGLTSLLTAATLAVSAGPALAQQPPDQAENNAPVEKHHSKLKGAAVGGVGGAMVGGKKGAVIGGAGGALYQHHKNKKAERRARRGH